MSVKSCVMALALTCGVGLASAAHAAPIIPAGSPAGTAVETVAYGCGPGWIPNRWGRCRPIYRPYGYGYGRPRFYGPRPVYGPPRYGYYRPRPPVPFF